MINLVHWSSWLQVLSIFYYSITWFLQSELVSLFLYKNKDNSFARHNYETDIEVVVDQGLVFTSAKTAIARPMLPTLVTFTEIVKQTQNMPKKKIYYKDVSTW